MSFLADVCARARLRVDVAAGAVPLDELRRRAQGLPHPPSFADALGGAGVALIAEIKRASPSKGHIADIPDPAALAGRYVAGGAAAVSVLTEPDSFLGTLSDLEAVVAAVDAPVLRKDFVVDPYQVWEARAAGAAAVLLIVAALEQSALSALLVVAAAAGVDTLVEVHDQDEAARAASALADAATGRRAVVGVNARDLATLNVDPSRFAAVRAALPPGALAVAESGVIGPDDVAAVAALGADAVLVGEHLVRAADPAAAAAALVAAGVRAPAAAP